MMFVSYTPVDTIGTEVGLMLLEKITNSIWHGGFFGAAILGIFTFLSLAKIAMDAIIEHKYESAIFEFVRLAIVVVLFIATGTATIFSMNIINFGYAKQAAQNGSTVASNIVNWFAGDINDTNPTSAETNVYGVPLMAEIYAIADNLAYQISNIMLNPQKTTTVDLANIVLDPRNILYYSWASMIKSSNDPGVLFKSFAKCYDHDAYEKLKFIQGDPMDCNTFNQMWVSTAQNMVNQIEQQGNVNPAVLSNMNYFVQLIQNNTLQDEDSMKGAYLGQELKIIEDAAKNAKKIENTNATINGTNPNTNAATSLINNGQAIIGFLMGAIGTVGANLASPYYFLESMMILIQEYAIAIMFLLLPIVVVVGLLPIFGNNYKLILKYAFSFFLIKLWIPVFWLIYVAMMDVSAILTASATTIHNGIHYINNGVQYAITTFVGQPAYAQNPPPPTPAQPQQQSGVNSVTVSTSNVPQNAIQQAASMSYDMAMAAEANKYSQFNAILLSFFAVAIPGVFGSAATYLVGRGTMEAGATAMAEGLYFIQKLGGMVSGLAGGIGKFGGSIRSAVGTATRMGTNAIKAVPGAIKAAPGAIKNAPDTVRNFWKDRQLTKELYGQVSVGRSAKALGVKMKRSTAENIRDAVSEGNGFIQDKEGGISAIYDKNYNLRGIIKKDGTMVSANSLSAEERAKYDLDIERSFGVINTETGDFVSSRFNRQAEIIPNYTEDRIGKIKDKKMLEKLNKMLK